ncbi:MAG: YhdP family protein [Panacagrimonas sp.]
MERVKRRVWTLAVSLMAVVLILGALTTAIFQLVITVVPQYREDLADYVSRVAHQPVDIGGIGLVWSATLTPRLELTDITLYGEDGETPALSAERLRLGFGLWRLLHLDTTPTRVELSGLELFAQIDEAGQFSLRGIDTAGGPSRAPQDWLRQLGRFHSVHLSRCVLQLDDARLAGALPRFRLLDAEIAFRAGKGSATADFELPSAMGSGATLDASITGDLERPETWRGSWSARIDDLTGLPWIDARMAPGSAVGFRDTQLQVYGSLHDGKLGPIGIGAEAEAIIVRTHRQQAQLNDLRLAAHLTMHDGGWTLGIERLSATGPDGAWPETRAKLRFDRPPEGPRIEAEAEYLRLADLAPWVALAPAVAASGHLKTLQRVTGAVRGLVLRLQRDEGGLRYSARADLENLGLKPDGESIAFEGLSGALSASENEGRLSLDKAAVKLSAPHLLEQALAFDALTADLGWMRSREAWELAAPRFSWALAGSKGEGGLRLRLPLEPGQSPHINLDARFSAADATRFKPYIPKIWPTELRHWLGSAIVAGRVPAGRLKLEGELAHFPFVDHPGMFALDIDAADTDFAYAPGWPAIEQVSGHLEFRGKQLAIRSDSARVMGNPITAVEALIPDLHEGHLGVVGQSQGDAARFYDFLRASPLAPRLAGLLSRTAASGEAFVQVNLQIPLAHAHETLVSGTVRTHGGRLDLTGLDEPVTDIHGELSFDNHGVRAEQLTGQMFDTPVQASIAPEGAGHSVLHGQFDFAPDRGGAGLSHLLPHFLVAGMEGSSRWNLRLPLDGADAGHVRLESDLQGLALTLPQPMKKPAADAWPTEVVLESEPAFPLRVTVEMPDRLGANLAFARPADGRTLHLRRATVRVGAGMRPHADEDRVFITGTAVDLDPLLWVKAVHAGPTDSGAAGGGLDVPFVADLNVGRLWLGAQNVEGVRLLHAPAAGGWLAQVSGNGAQGDLAFQHDDLGGVLRGRFQYVNVAARSEGTVQAAAQDANDHLAASTPIHPGQLPLLDLMVDDLHIARTELGRFELRTARIADGQRIERLRSLGPGGEIDARGQWRRAANTSSADVRFTIDNNAVDQLLSGFGYTPNLTARRSRFNGDLNWPAREGDGARGLEWARAEGRLDIDLEKGQLRAVEPGAGRVLGLINFWALPRRLTLDFRDVVSEGLSFDQVNGRFDIGGGNATTQDLDIQAPSLKMEVRGRVGLAARDYDQRVKVYPDVSAGITLGALLVGGPIAGVLALIAQEVLDQPLDQVGQLNYRLTGGWDDPQVVREGGLIPGLNRKSEKKSGHGTAAKPSMTGATTP